jgi:hypothetical protein
VHNTVNNTAIPHNCRNGTAPLPYFCAGILAVPLLNAGFLHSLPGPAKRLAPICRVAHPQLAQASWQLNLAVCWVLNLIACTAFHILLQPNTSHHLYMVSTNSSLNWY